MGEEPYLNARWKNRPMSAGEYVEFSRKCLVALCEFDKAFDDLFLWGQASGERLTFARRYVDMDNRILSYIADSEVRYDNPDSRSVNITQDSMSATGFTASFSNSEDPDNQITVAISAGASDGDTGAIDIAFPRKGRNRFLQLEYTIELLRSIIDCASPQNAVITTREFRKQLRVMVGRGKCEMGWITYCADLSSTNMLPPELEDVAYENLPGGGFLIVLRRPFLFGSDSESIASAARLQEGIR